MKYYGLDIGGNTGFTVFDLERKKLIDETVLDTRDQTEEEAAEVIIDKLLDIAVRYPNDKHIIVSEQFISSRTMKPDVFRSAKIEAMVRFYFRSMGKSKFEYHDQVPQKRLPFVEKSKTWVKHKGKTKCHIVDSFAHILAYLHDQNIDLPDLYKSGRVKKELKFEDYGGGIEF